MHLIWKRPDGYESARPEDFKKHRLSNGGQLWLHKEDLNWYPFQVSGDWKGRDDTQKINQLVNLLEYTPLKMREYLETLVEDDLLSSGALQKTAENIVTWLRVLKLRLKGDSWEIEILECALNDVESLIQRALAVKLSD